MRRGNEDQAREPIRSCVVCKTRQPKRLLRRHVKGPGPGLVPDPEQRLPGRGFYLCEKEECADKFSRYQGWRKKCKGVVHDKNQG